MEEKDFAKMSEEDLKRYILKLSKKLETAQWFLRNRVSERKNLTK